MQNLRDFLGRESDFRALFRVSQEEAHAKPSKTNDKGESGNRPYPNPLPPPPAWLSVLTDADNNAAGTIMQSDSSAEVKLRDRDNMRIRGLGDVAGIPCPAHGLPGPARDTPTPLRPRSNHQVTPRYRRKLLALDKTHVLRASHMQRSNHYHKLMSIVSHRLTCT
jgi:hypothetical protein